MEDSPDVEERISKITFMQQLSEQLSRSTLIFESTTSVIRSVKANSITTHKSMSTKSD